MKTFWKCVAKFVNPQTESTTFSNCHVDLNKTLKISTSKWLTLVEGKRKSFNSGDVSHIVFTVILICIKIWKQNLTSWFLTPVKAKREPFNNKRMNLMFVNELALMSKVAKVHYSMCKHQKEKINNDGVRKDKNTTDLKIRCFSLPIWSKWNIWYREQVYVAVF